MARRERVFAMASAGPLPPLQPREPKPPLADVGAAADLIISPHAARRMSQRGIHVDEAFSAIAEPDYTLSVAPDETDEGDSYPGSVKYVRGAVEVWVDPTLGEINTVVDDDSALRSFPRQPMPYINGAASMARSTPVTPPPAPKTIANGRAPTKALPSKPAKLVKPAGAKATILTPYADVIPKKRLDADRAWCLTPHPEDDEYRKVWVGPSLATTLIEEHNTMNRPLDEGRIAAWIDVFTAGQFKRTHQGVAIDWNVVLQDGQNRMEAIRRLDITVLMWVLTGADPGNYPYVDAGAPRTYRDVLSVRKLPDPAALGAILRLVYLFENREDVRDWRRKVNNATIVEAFDSDPEMLREAVSQARKMARPLQVVPSAAGAAFYLLMTHANDTEVVREFFDSMVERNMGKGRDARKALVDRFANASRAGGKRIHGIEALMLIIKAWGHYLQREVPHVLTWSQGMKKPEIIRVGRDG